MYYKHFHRFIDFKNPKTFNEKLQLLKVYDRKPECSNGRKLRIAEDSV